MAFWRLHFVLLFTSIWVGLITKNICLYNVMQHILKNDHAAGNSVNMRHAAEALLHTLFVDMTRPYGDIKLLFAHYLFSNKSYSLLNLTQKDNWIKVETCRSCYDFMSWMSHCDLNSTSMYEQRSKGQAPAVLGGLH